MLAVTCTSGVGTAVAYQARPETLLAVWSDRELGELTDEDDETAKMLFRPLLLHCDQPVGNEPVAVASNASVSQADGLIRSSKASTRKRVRGIDANDVAAWKSSRSPGCWIMVQ